MEININKCFLTKEEVEKYKEYINSDTKFCGIDAL